jgi:hypothetical protein
MDNNEIIKDIDKLIFNNIDKLSLLFLFTEYNNIEYKEIVSVKAAPSNETKFYFYEKNYKQN